MCCESSPPAKKRFLKALGRRKTFVAWKLLREDGRSGMAEYKYSPGRHGLVKPLQRYGGARGFYFYMNKPIKARFGGVLIPVIVHRGDLLAIEQGAWDGPLLRQGVANAITIRKSDWDAAFSKPTKRRR